MQATPKVDLEADGDKRKRHNLNVIVGEKALALLGLPKVFYKVQVTNLWGDRFRVNIFVGADASSVIIAHSYFLVADEHGNISAATPKITKRY